MLKIRNLGLKKYLPRTLFGRSLVILIAPVFLIQLVTSIVFFDNHLSKMMDRLSYAVAGEIAAIANIFEDYEGEENQAIRQNQMRLVAQSLDLLVSFQRQENIDDVKIRPPAFLWASFIEGSLSQELESQLRRHYKIQMDFEEKWVTVYVQLKNGLLNVTFPQRRLFSSSSYIFLLWVIGTSLVVLFIAIIFMRNQVRPIRKLAVAAERFGKGRDVLSFKPEGAREVRQAAEAFLNMHRRIKRQIEQRTEMLASVSHDLRTPLTRLKLELAMLEKKADVKDMQQDIAEMEKMIAGYLDFVRGDGDEAFEYQSVKDLFDIFKNSAERQGLNVHLADIDDGVKLSVKPLAFQRGMNNILSNAAKYAQNIWMSATQEDEKLMLCVEDDGPGIAEDKLEEVFKPFYRVETSRNKETGGIGLGLPIAMDIINAHGGRMWLEKSEQGGLKVCIRMPQ